MKIVIYSVSARSPDWLTLLIQDYQKKLKYFCDLEVVDLKAVKLSRGHQNKKKSEEGDLIAKHLKSGDLVIACDGGGKSYTSPEFSRRLEKWLGMGKKRIVFLIGGAYGLPESVLERASEKVSLSPLTFNHYLAKSVLFEQIYRGFTIIKGIEYHN